MLSDCAFCAFGSRISAEGTMRRSKPVIGIAAGSATSPPSGATKSASPVIVVLNNQSGSTAATESPLISQVKAAGGTHIIGYKAVASFAAPVSPAEAAALGAHPAVAVGGPG